MRFHCTPARRRARSFAGPLAVALLAACATLPANPERDATMRLERGLRFLDAEQFGNAYREIAWVYTHCAGRQRGATALLLLTSLELDPRNSGRRPDVAAQNATAYLRVAHADAPLRPLAETLYLLSIELGAPEAAAPAVGLVSQDRPTEPADGAEADGAADAATDPRPAPAADDAPAVVGCGAAVDGAVAPERLPSFPGLPLAARIGQAQARTESLSARVRELEQVLSAREAELAAQRKELQRIREALQP